jgi:hypothetical protein
MSLAPVVLFVYARPEHTQRTLQSLRMSDRAIESDLLIFADGPRNSAASEGVTEVARIVQSASKAKWFRSVRVTTSDRNQGLALSVINGVTAVLQETDRVIVLEDDLEVSSDFLCYMNTALDYYKRDQRIWSISGYSPQLESLKRYPNDVFLSTRASSWGWGSWRRSWDMVDWTTPAYGSLEFNFRRRRRFNQGGRDMSAMLDAQMDGRVDSWAIRWCHAQFENGMYSVCPVVTKVHNIGLDGSGTHRAVEGSPTRTLGAQSVVFESLEYDSIVGDDFARVFNKYNKCPPLSFARHVLAKKRNGKKADG